MKTLLLIIFIILTGCSHTQVPTKSIDDEGLTCNQIKAAHQEVKNILSDIDGNTGLSGRNIAMGLFFWPGIIVNQMNAADARKSANERLSALTDLYTRKQCK